MATLSVQNALAMQRLGCCLAHAITENAPTTLLLRGPLGSGKTTLTRALVEALPGGYVAEPASPTFTLCNRYPTSPPVLHCDLYRCPGNPADEILDGLDDPHILTVVEWAEYLPAVFFPQDYLDIAMQACEELRLLTLYACGPHATALQRQLLHMWSAQVV
ncbi:MAG: tRNA (adenosine(37)-N6)-threonylcarbamoyltransferase complex ATPase subunit type 1 TsaE [Desulfovibrio sp.]|nr:tRNA (adenosine(37)-N6)-threonylcarbamoyltransferase complex ATPase subunit type 1 TsaE [Desulfovibrio sp.]